MNPMLFRLNKWLCGAALMVLVSACAVGPDYQRPVLDVGAHYKEAGAAAPDGGRPVTRVG